MPMYFALALFPAAIVVLIAIWLKPYRLYAYAAGSLYVAGMAWLGALDAIWRMREPSSVWSAFAARMTFAALAMVGVVGWWVALPRESGDLLYDGFLASLWCAPGALTRETRPFVRNVTRVGMAMIALLFLALLWERLRAGA
jgi:hypothetical protein